MTVIKAKRKSKKDTKGIYCPKCHQRVLKALFIDFKAVHITCSCDYNLKPKDMVIKNV